MKQRSESAAIVQKRFVSERELHAITGISPRTWQKYRLFGLGPRYYKPVGAVKYDLDEVISWITANAFGGGDGKA